MKSPANSKTEGFKILSEPIIKISISNSDKFQKLGDPRIIIETLDDHLDCLLTCKSHITHTVRAYSSWLLFVLRFTVNVTIIQNQFADN
jgi:hypothetical protein